MDHPTEYLNLLYLVVVIVVDLHGIWLSPTLIISYIVTCKKRLLSYKQQIH